MQTMSIHIGLNRVDPARYNGWRGELLACEADAAAMADLAAQQQIAKRVRLCTAEATFARVMAELRQAAASLTGGDYLLLTFAGHGASYKHIPTYRPDPPPTAGGAAPGEEGPATGVHAPGEDDDPYDDEDDDDDDAPDEDDGRDEAWCLHDTYLLDDEIHDALLGFAPGVRICVVSDSCYSGTVTRGDRAATGAMAIRREPAANADHPIALRERRVPAARSDKLYRRQFRETYGPRSAAVTAARARRAGAHIVLLAACQDHEVASEGPAHGLFTEHLLAVWQGGAFTGSHRELVAAIGERTKSRQHPNLYVTGTPGHGFEDEPPFLSRPRRAGP